MFKYRIAAPLLLAAVTAASQTGAAPVGVVPVLPPSADPARVEERLSPITAPSLEAPVEVAPPSLAVHAPPGAKEAAFMLHGIAVEGVSVYSSEQLRPLYAEYLGRKITVQTLYEIAAAITQRYREDGYVLARALVPQQEIGEAAVRIQVVEGYVGEVKLENGVARNAVLEDFSRRVQAMRPLHMPTLERLLLSLNDMAGIRAKAVLEPAERAAPGEVTLRLGVERTLRGGSLTFDDYGSRYIGPYQVTASAWVADQILPYDQLSVRLLGASQLKELRYGEISYAVPLNALGTSLSASFNKSRAEPGYRLEPFDVASDSTAESLGLSHSFIHARDEALAARIGIEHKDTETQLLGTRLYRDRLLVASGGVTYSKLDGWNGSSAADLSLRQGIDALDARRTGSPDLSREEGHSDFTTLGLTLSRLQAIDGPWQIYASASGQWASSPLLASEEFGLGGQRYGRAYDPSEITGDEGLAFAVELRYSALELSDSYRVMPFVYWDIGRVWNLDTNGDSPSLSSAGAGARLSADNGMQLNITLAQPLTRPQANPFYGNPKSSRFLAQLNWQF